MTVDFEEQGWRYLETAARRAAGTKCAARVVELSPGDGAARWQRLKGESTCMSMQSQILH